MGDKGKQIPVFDLGAAPYIPVQQLQGRLRAAVIAGSIPGVLLLLEHEPVITLGAGAGEDDLRTAASECDLLSGAGIPVVRSERGGQATLHAPGQLVSYPIVPVPGHDLRAYVHGLEEILVVLMRDLGVTAYRREGRPGLYIDGAKIASVGLRCRRWVASHGTSLNVGIDLSLFDRIVSCGEPGLEQTSLEARTGRRLAMRDIKQMYVDAAVKVFGWELLPLRAACYDNVQQLLGIQGVPVAPTDSIMEKRERAAQGIAAEHCERAGTPGPGAMERA
ncbi:MAG: lipoyl(octanoyl) transferase LipB [Actinobacteria bacterium]|nr:lipoyl(octanoyl) transferase LipB [Actinomycetota bacterium]